MEMNVRFDSINEVLEFAKLFNGASGVCPAECKEICKEACVKKCDPDKCEDDVPVDTETTEKPKAKRKPRKKAEPKKEEAKEEPKEEPITVEVTKVTVDDKEVPTMNGNAIVDEKPEVNETPEDIHTADAPKLFNTVMSVNETVRAEMMTGNITREALMAVGPKLAELNAALYEKFKDATIDSKDATVAEIVRMINAGEALNLLG